MSTCQQWSKSYIIVTHTFSLIVTPHRPTDKKGTKKRYVRAASTGESSQTPRVEHPVKRGKSFVEKIRSFRFPGRNRARSSGDDDLSLSLSSSPKLVKQARSEDNLLSPTPGEDRPVSPLVVAYRSVPVSREGTPQPDETVVPVEISAELQEYYNQKFVFDEIKEFLATRPDEGEVASGNVLDEFDPEEHPWRKEETAIEQLRGFLATCP